jgi:hypothetical protein
VPLGGACFWYRKGWILGNAGEIELKTKKKIEKTKY